MDSQHFPQWHHRTTLRSARNLSLGLNCHCYRRHQVAERPCHCRPPFRSPRGCLSAAPPPVLVAAFCAQLLLSADCSWISENLPKHVCSRWYCLAARRNLSPAKITSPRARTRPRCRRRCCRVVSVLAAGFAGRAQDEPGAQCI